MTSVKKEAQIQATRGGDNREGPVLGHWMPRWVVEKGDFEESAL